MSALIVASRAQTYGISADVDVNIAQVIGHELLKGGELYTELWDHRPPLTYIVTAGSELLTGWGPAQILLIGVLLSLASLVGIWHAGRVLGPVAGVTAAAFWTCFESDIALQAHHPNGEAFVNAAVIWGAAFLVRGSTRWGPAVSWLLATLSKSNAIVFPAAFALALLSGARDRGRAVRDVGVWLAVGAVGWLLVLAWFGAQGRLQHFWEAVVAYPQYYRGDAFENILRGMSPPLVFNRVMFALLPAAFMTAAAFLLRPSQPLGEYLAAGILAAWIGIILPGQFFAHYYQLYMPFFALGGGWTTGLVFQRSRTRGLFTAIAALSASILIQVPNLFANDAARIWTAFPTNADRFFAEDEVMPVLFDSLRPGESLYHIGTQSAYYIRTQTSPPVGVFFFKHMCRSWPNPRRLENPAAGRLTEMTMSRLQRDPPGIIVLDSLYASYCPEHPIFSWLDENYVERPELGAGPRAQFYTRREE